MEAPEASVTPAKLVNASLTSKVRVTVRVRLFHPHEITAALNGDLTPCAAVIKLESQPYTQDDVIFRLKDSESSRKECYRLDSFFSEEGNDVATIFDKEVRDLIPRIFEGFNSTVFAYGATGSGKTYTMQGTEEKPGLMSLAMSTVLDMCQGSGGAAEISYYEVYMDRCYDLLEGKSQEISVLDDIDGKIHLKGLSRMPIKSMQDFDVALSCGIQRRKTGHRGFNDVSSRSHGVLVISVSVTFEDDPEAVVTGKLNLIDLAGISTWKSNLIDSAGNKDDRRACSEGVRLQESAKINQSLFSLSNVIYALNNNLSRVPYRESKLTRILQDSLGGTSQALMVACLNPGEYQESVHTVSLAARSRQITNLVPSAHKQETPKIKVHKEAKLYSGFESTRKTKSAQKVQVSSSPFLGKPPLSSTKKFNTNLGSLKKLNTSRRDGKERTITSAVKNLFVEGPVDHDLESLQNASKDNSNCEASSRSTSCLGESSNHGEKPTSFVNSSPIGERKSTLISPSRIALSPVNTNIKLFDAPVTNAPRTPKTPFPVNCMDNNFQNMGTPLEKFTARGSQVKNYLVQEYVDFLNSASREELLETKGIGGKYADYILKLRETSPLESLNDLEKVGLSSKQIHSLFNKAAIGVFDQQGLATTCRAAVSQVE